MVYFGVKFFLSLFAGHWKKGFETTFTTFFPSFVRHKVFSERFFCLCQRHLLREFVSLKKHTPRLNGWSLTNNIGNTPLSLVIC